VTRPFAVAATALACVLFVAVGGFVLVTSKVEGDSMRPTLVDGELIVANPFNRLPRRFDVALVRAAPGTQVVKRVIGMPGDRIQIVPGPVSSNPVIRVAPAGAGGWTEVRWSPVYGQDVLPGPWSNGIECCGPDGRTSSPPAVATVPPGGYFVLGDNPDGSVDSRTFGFTAPDAVRAVVVGQVWPPSPLPDPGYRLEPVTAG
jgi:signal peptidase I